MLSECATCKGTTLQEPNTTTIAPEDPVTMQAIGDFSLKKALPIRFIEFYTGGKLGPESITLLFAHKQGIDWNRQMEAADKLTAYHWQQGKIIPLKRTEWESILHSVTSLSERYDKTDRHFDEWRSAALKLLPVAFVWRSEFDEAYDRAIVPERDTLLGQAGEFDCLAGDAYIEAKETSDTPYIPPELVDMVFEGFELGSMTISQRAPETKQISKRHVITDEERKTKGKSAIQVAVEVYLNNNPEGNKSGFYTFLKKQIKLPIEVTLMDDKTYPYFFKEVTEKGSQEGVYLKHPKEGRKEGDPGWNHYAANSVSGIISKERKNRKNLLHKK